MAALLAAFLFAGSQRALAECGFAAAASMQGGEAMRGVSAAHPSLPAGTRVIVRNQRKGRSIIVRIAGRSAYFSDGIIDLSPDAMSALGMDDSAPICLEVVSYGSQKRGYEKPSLIGRLLEAVVPKRDHYANAGSRTRSASARSGTRSAKVHHRRRDYARSHHGSSKRYAKLHRRHSLRRSSRRAARS